MSAAYQEQARAAFAQPVMTARLAIHPWRVGEEKAVAEFLNADDRAFPKRDHWFYYGVDQPFDEERVRQEVIPALSAGQKRSIELYIRTRSDNRIVGMIDFSRDPQGRDRVSYFILPSKRRHGYAFEAYAACVNHAVEDGFLSGNLYAHTDPDNRISQQFLAKAGFENCGLTATKNNVGEPIEVVTFNRALSKDRPLSL